MNERANLRTHAVVSAFLLAMATVAHGRTITVGRGAGYDFQTIQAAIDDCDDGDVVIVAKGDYENINFGGMNITVKSTDPNDPNVVARTVIYGSGYDDDYYDGDSVVTFESGEDSNCVLNGFTITGGYLDWGNGAGISCYSSSPMIINCIIRGNVTYEAGGGMYNENANPTLTNCSFIHNRGGYDGSYGGAGMYNYRSNPTLLNCTFHDNMGGCCGCADGAGMFNMVSDPTLINCMFTDNYAEGGVGMCNLYSNTTLINCTFSGNLGDYDGAMYNQAGSAILLNCTFSGNQGGSDGGGMCNYDSKIIATGCMFSANEAKRNGGGMYNWASTSVLTNCTFAANSAVNGSALACDSYLQQYRSTIQMSNCILWNGGNEVIWNNDDSDITITYSNIQDGWPGEGNIDGDPSFYFPGCWVDPCTPEDLEDDVWVEGDYHLRPGSPCIDAGDNSAVPADNADLDDDSDTNEPIPFDLDGTPRFSDDPNAPDKGSGTPPLVDMGAYEGYKSVFSFLPSTKSVIVPEGQTVTFTVALARDPLDTTEVTVSYLTGDSDITIESGEVLTFDSSNYWQAQTVTLAAAQDIDPYNGTAVILVDARGFVPLVVTATEEDDEIILSILYVDEDAPSANNGTSWLTAYTNLQDALTYAAVVPEVQEIRVAQGIYKPDRGVGIAPGSRISTFQLINGVSIKGGYSGFGGFDPNARNINKYETILSGDLDGDDVDVNDPADLMDEPTRSENSYHVVTGSGCDKTAVLDGFTIVAGNASGTHAYKNGGGMYNYRGSPSVLNCTFRINAATLSGGGMCNYYYSSPIVTNGSFIGNSAGRIYGDGYGGAVCNGSYCNPKLANCTFVNNSALDYGGGMYNVQNSPTLTNCTFSNNSTVLNHGGGMYNKSSKPSLINCTFSGNSAGAGGGIYNTGTSSPTITNCTFTNNLARRHHGGGMYNYYGFPMLTSCTFIGNTSGRNGGGMYNNRCSPTLTNCTFTNNLAELGGGIYNQPQSKVSRRSAPKLTNCILWANSDSQGTDETAQIYNGIPVVNYSCVQCWTGAFGGTANIGTDPLLAPDGYHLQPGSPCINTGDPNYPVDPNESDIDGQPRIIGGRVDIGADEFHGNNVAPVADAGEDQTVYAWIDGMAKVTLDGTSSYDDDGHPLTYNWNWIIDGQTYTATGATPTIELPAGEHFIQLIVNDRVEDSEPNQLVITVIESIESSLQISPKTINRYSRMPRILALLRLPEAITINRIDSEQPLLLYPAGIKPVYQRITQSGTSGTQRTSIFAFFDKVALVDTLADDGRVELQIVGQLKTGQYFYGTDTIRIISPRDNDGND